MPYPQYQNKLDENLFRNLRKTKPESIPETFKEFPILTMNPEGIIFFANDKLYELFKKTDRNLTRAKFEIIIPSRIAYNALLNDARNKDSLFYQAAVALRGTIRTVNDIKFDPIVKKAFVYLRNRIPDSGLELHLQVPIKENAGPEKPVPMKLWFAGLYGPSRAGPEYTRGIVCFERIYH